MAESVDGQHRSVLGIVKGLDLTASWDHAAALGVTPHQTVLVKHPDNNPLGGQPKCADKCHDLYLSYEKDWLPHMRKHHTDYYNQIVVTNQWSERMRHLVVLERAGEKFSTMSARRVRSPQELVL